MKKTKYSWTKIRTCRNKRFAIIGMLLGLSILSLVGCGKKEKENDKLTVAVTIVPEATFVKEVCGDLVNVVTLVPPGNSPETYEPAPAELEQFSDAAIYFSIGVPVEEATSLPEGMEKKKVALQDAVAKVYEDRTFENGERDVHIWLSPKRVKVMVQEIATQMSELDPANASVYEKNATAYLAELDEVDQAIVAALENVENKKFVAYHPAFGYLAEDYGLEMFALEEEGKEATIEHLQEMIDLAKSENIKVIFYQEEMDSSQAEAYAEEVGGTTMKLSPLAADYTENMKLMAATLAEGMN